MVSTILVLIAVNILGYLVIYLVLNQRIRRVASSSAQIAEIREEVNRLVIELNQTTDRNIGLIEDRIASLTELLSKTDKKMTLLKRESEKHEVGAKVYGRISASRDGRPAEGGHDNQYLEPNMQSAYGHASAQGQGRPKAGASMEGHASATSRQPRIELVPVEPAAGPEQTRALGHQDLRERVVSLYRAGFTASIIASRVGAPLGEVELIIALERQKEGT